MDDKKALTTFAVPALDCKPKSTFVVDTIKETSSPQASPQAPLVSSANEYHEEYSVSQDPPTTIDNQEAQEVPTKDLLVEDMAIENIIEDNLLDDAMAMVYQSEMDEIWGCRASGQGSLLLLVSRAQGRHRS